MLIDFKVNLMVIIIQHTNTTHKLSIDNAILCYTVEFYVTLKNIDNI